MEVVEPDPILRVGTWLICDDQAAATILEGGPDGTFETMTVGNSELHGYDPELFTDILSELAALASTARQEGRALYCWMC